MCHVSPLHGGGGLCLSDPRSYVASGHRSWVRSQIQMILFKRKSWIQVISPGAGTLDPHPGAWPGGEKVLIARISYVSTLLSFHHLLKEQKTGSGGAVRMEQRSNGSSLAVWFLANFQFMLVFQTPAYQLLIKLHFERAKHSRHLIEHACGTVGQQFRFLHPYLQVSLKGSRIISSLQVFLWPLCKQI